jgi:peptide/nickel transport system substrate-binding protein
MTRRDYWTRTLQRRVTRRRAILGTAAVAGGAALLSACGGDDSDSQEGDLIKEQPDRSDEAKGGGTLKWRGGGGATVDAIGSNLTTDRDLSSLFYNRLLMVEPGVNRPSTGEPTGDAAERWEISPDGLKITFKIRGNLGTDPRPPTNSRNLDAADVLSSWNRWASVSTLRGDILNSINPGAPITSVETPDNSTFVVNLAFPSALVIPFFSDGFYFFVMPKEGNEGGYDPKLQSRGAGPYSLESLEPSVHTMMVRNPNYYLKPAPYYERMEFFNLTERAAEVAQFETGNIDLARPSPGNVGAVDNDNVLEIYQRLPKAVMYLTPIMDNGAMSRFGYAAGSPFVDERLRQAMSMVQDRDALSEFFTNASALEAAGVPVKPRWQSHATASFDVWEDPTNSSALGGNAKYFQYNLAEARKLLEAAGQVGVAFEFNADNYIPPNVRTSEVIGGHIADSKLFTVNIVNRDYTTWSIQHAYRGRGDYTGMFHGGTAFKFTAASYMYSLLDPGPGTAFYNEDVARQLFPDLVRVLNAAVRELDTEKQESLVKEAQTLAAKNMPFLPTGAVAEHVTLAWPWVAQAAVLKDYAGDGTGWRTAAFRRYWYDEKARTS